MNLRKPTYLISLLAVFILAASTMVVSQSDNASAHVDSHTLAMDGLNSHWTAGGMTYRFKDKTNFPSGWTTAINSAAQHLAGNTLATGITENTSSSNIVEIGTWNWFVAFGDCDLKSKLGGTLACTYPYITSGFPDPAVTANTRNNLSKVKIVFDKRDVYPSGNSSQPPLSKWTNIKGGATELKRVAAHEFAHALGYFDHIDSTVSRSSPLNGYPNYYALSVHDKWEVNRLYLHSSEASHTNLGCRKKIDLNRMVTATSSSGSQ